MADITTDTNNLLATAQTLATNSLNKASQSNLSASVRDGLISSAGSIQTLLNDIFKNNGLITEKQVSDLDREIELGKLKLLEAKSNNTVINLALYVGLGVVIVGLLWYFTSPKEN